jgi:hypothetical protein
VPVKVLEERVKVLRMLAEVLAVLVH